MSNYPPGFRPNIEKEIIDMKCPECGSEWEALLITEFGMSFFAEDDMDICPECGAEGERKYVW
jgi:endogenous inhibitor of DNA gyrase (YacG/DUF329 family)